MARENLVYIVKHVGGLRERGDMPHEVDVLTNAIIDLAQEIEKLDVRMAALEQARADSTNK